MTQMRMSHKKKQPENKYSCISLLHLHTKVPQCPVFSYNSFALKGLFLMLGKNSQFYLSSHSSQDGQPGLSVTAQPIFADQDLSSARVHQNITSLFIIEKNSDAIKLYLYLWDSYLAIRNRKVLPATRLSHSGFSMPLNICLLKPYLWPLWGRVFLLLHSYSTQQSSAHVSCVFQENTILHTILTTQSPLGYQSQLLSAPEAGICLWMQSDRKLHFAHLILCPTSPGCAALGSPPPSFHHLAVWWNQHLLVSAGMAKPSTSNQASPCCCVMPGKFCQLFVCVGSTQAVLTT